MGLLFREYLPVSPESHGDRFFRIDLGAIIGLFGHLLRQGCLPDFHWFRFQGLDGHNEFIAFFQLGDSNRLYVLQELLLGQFSFDQRFSSETRSFNPSFWPIDVRVKGGQPWVPENKSVPSKVHSKEPGSLLLPIS